jgi:hypothetical protein
MSAQQTTKAMYQGQEVETIDITPTWEQWSSMMLRMYPDLNSTGQKEVRAEFARMAQFADKWVAHLKATEQA